MATLFEHWDQQRREMLKARGWQMVPPIGTVTYWLPPGVNTQQVPEAEAFKWLKAEEEAEGST